MPTKRFFCDRSVLAALIERKYNLSAPKGVNGRNSDNTLIEQVLSWQPSVSLHDGMELTYRWIYDQTRTKAVCAQHRSAARERRRMQGHRRPLDKQEALQPQALDKLTMKEAYIQILAQPLANGIGYRWKNGN